MRRGIQAARQPGNHRVPRPGQPFRSPDPRAAARYYRDAAQRGDAGAAAPRAALRAWLEEQAPRNQSAADALKEFWP